MTWSPGRLETSDQDARNPHWMMVYGDYLREVGYAVRSA